MSENRSALMFDTASNFHPFECDGPGKCIHHDRVVTYRGEGDQRHHALDTIEDAKWTVEHDPATCALCDPEYDCAPNPAWDERVDLERRREARNG
ncbi:MAG TPA: hypothetical protein VN085_05530 [Vicinamibacterales bacterium]|nr:hypothetical protein [Vicinamibacterales bacterium]